MRAELTGSEAALAPPPEPRMTGDVSRSLACLLVFPVIFTILAIVVLACSGSYAGIASRCRRRSCGLRQGSGVPHAIRMPRRRFCASSRTQLRRPRISYSSD